MAEFKKHVDDSLYYIRHAMRELPEGKSHGNEDIDMTLTEEKNYSLLHGRCQTAAEANSYRKELEKELFKYNRKGLVKTIEIVIQCPDDCTDKEAFFETSYRYVCDKVLPMGERCVVTAQVHGDEHKFLKDENGNYRLDETGQKIDISKDHLHIIAVPAVPDTKHAEYEWKLSAHDLTSKGRLRQFHPGLQKACDDAGIQATVYQKKEGDGKTIGLSVKQLKEITNKTGIVIDKSLTVEQLAEILQENQNIKLYDKELRAKFDIEVKKNVAQAVAHSQELLEQKDAEYQNLKTKANRIISAKNTEIETANEKLAAKDQEILHLKEQLEEIKSHSIDHESSKQNYEQQISELEASNQRLKAKANEIIAGKNAEIESANEKLVSKDNEISGLKQNNSNLQHQVEELQEALKQKEIELEQAQSKAHEVEATSKEWGSDNAWGTQNNSWGRTHNIGEEKTW